jgi:hypothetical protein
MLAYQLSLRFPTPLWMPGEVNEIELHYALIALS